MMFAILVWVIFNIYFIQYLYLLGENFKWKYIRPIGDLVDARRNHVATVVGRFMIINGGINPKDQFLNDFWSFDFSKFNIIYYGLQLIFVLK